MNFIQYKIQKKDTLQTIAEKQQISVKELVDFHNQHSGMTGVIIGNALPIHLEHIIVSKEHIKKAIRLFLIKKQDIVVYRLIQPVLMVR